MKVVIAGGGFGGMNLAKALASKNDIEVVLVDLNNYHFFPPLIYQVATSFIEPSNISYPFRKMFQRKQNLRFHHGAVTAVHANEQYIETTNGTIDYDYLVLSMGTETNYFGMENVKSQALPMKTIDDALNLRNRLLLNLERATRVVDKKEQETLTTIVIAGGGPTGVEVAGMLAEMGRRIKKKDYPELDDTRGKIYLVDAVNTLLAPMSEKSQKEAIRVLKSLGVIILLGTAVKDYKDRKVALSNGDEISAATLVWASGVVARSVNGLPAESITRGRRILVDEFNQVQGVSNIFAIGDQCMQLTDKNYPAGHPQLAQVAIQQGQLLAKNLLNIRDGRSMKPFSYFNKGSMAIISKFKAVVDLPKGFFKGFFAWLTWLFVHIIPIAGYRNKFKVAYNWLWSFITNDPTLRLIIRPRIENAVTPPPVAPRVETKKPEVELMNTTG
jgi:NADH dehydrogenase